MVVVFYFFLTIQTGIQILNSLVLYVSYPQKSPEFNFSSSLRVKNSPIPSSTTPLVTIRLLVYLSSLSLTLTLIFSHLFAYLVS